MQTTNSQLKFYLVHMLLRFLNAVVTSDDAVAVGIMQCQLSTRGDVSLIFEQKLGPEGLQSLQHEMNSPGSGDCKQGVGLGAPKPFVPRNAKPWFFCLFLWFLEKPVCRLVFCLW